MEVALPGPGAAGSLRILGAAAGWARGKGEGPAPGPFMTPGSSFGHESPPRDTPMRSPRPFHQPFVPGLWGDAPQGNTHLGMATLLSMTPRAREFRKWTGWHF